MKRFLLTISLLLAVTLSGVAQQKKELKFVDATTLNICGHTLPTEKSPYFRFDSEPYNFKEQNIIRYSRYSTGMYVMFKTNSSQVAATWENVPRRVGDNMSAITQLGLDLYINDNGTWRFCQSGRVSTDPEKNKRTKTIVKNLALGEKEFMLYLPLWCELKSLEIGVDADATIEAIPSPYKYKVINYGTSLTHGASASRPEQRMVIFASGSSAKSFARSRMISAMNSGVIAALAEAETAFFRRVSSSALSLSTMSRAA